MYTRREFAKIVQLLAARGLLSDVLPGLELLQSSKLEGQAPAPLNSDRIQSLRQVSGTLADYMQLSLDQLDQATVTVAQQPAILSFGLQADFSSANTSNSFTFGGVLSIDVEHGRFAAGLFLTTTTSETVTTNPLPDAALGLSASIGRGQLDEHGFYGAAAVSSAAAVSGTGEGGGISISQNGGYEAVSASLLIDPGLPSATSSVSDESASYTYGSGTVMQVDLASWIGDMQNALWDASQDPMDPMPAPPW